MTRVLALDYGAARCGCAISDPSGMLATPLAAVARPDASEGLRELVQLIRDTGASRVVVGLPIGMSGEEGAQAAAARAFAGRLRRAADVPVELYDERLTTRQAARTGGTSDEDSRAAAHLLAAWLDALGKARTGP